MTDLIHIKDVPSLSRDLNSKAVINTSQREFQEALQSKKRRLDLTNRMNSLEEKMDLILTLLTKDNS